MIQFKSPELKLLIKEGGKKPKDNYIQRFVCESHNGYGTWVERQIENMIQCALWQGVKGEYWKDSWDNKLLTMNGIRQIMREKGASQITTQDRNVGFALETGATQTNAKNHKLFWSKKQALNDKEITIDNFLEENMFPKEWGKYIFALCLEDIKVYFKVNKDIDDGNHREIDVDFSIDFDPIRSFMVEVREDEMYSYHGTSTYTTYQYGV